MSTAAASRCRGAVSASLAASLAAAALALAPATTAAAPPSGLCPNAREGAGWTLSTTTFDPTFSRHPYVGNGYLAQRVPPAGTGYAATGEETGWPLYTPRYDGAFVAGLYAADPALAEGRAAIAAIPTWSTLSVRAGAETYSAQTPAARISDFRQSVHMGCGVVRTSLTWTTADGRATDLVYDVLADRRDPHVAAVRLQMVPRWTGEATVTDAIDGAGARRLVQTGGGAVRGDPTVDVTFSAQTTGTAGAVASTLAHDAAVRPSARKRSPKAEGLRSVRRGSRR